MDPFETLGIPARFDLDLQQIEQRFRELSRVLHPDRHTSGTPLERRLALGKAVEVNEAHRMLRDPVRRAEALLRRAGVDVREGAEPRVDPGLLMQMMEMREDLASARKKRDVAAIERQATAARDSEKRLLSRICEVFGNASASLTVEQANAVLGHLGELRYYRRFLDEVSSIEDELIDNPSPSL